MTIQVCDNCHHSDTCKNSLATVVNKPMLPFTQRSEKLPCWACSHPAWRKHDSHGQRECDICHIVKNLDGDSVKIKHTRG